MEKSKLTKLCTNCGLTKPRAAFLHLTGTQGAVYGTICSDCQAKTGKDINTNELDESEEFSRIDSGNKIDAKARVHIEIKKKELRQKIEEQNKEEHEKSVLKKEQRTTKIATIEDKEKEHRKRYLEKSSFLTVQKTDAQQRALNEKIKIEEDSKFEAVKQEEKLKTIDLSVGPFIPSQTGHQIKLGDTYNKFKAWLGSSAPLARSQAGAPIQGQTQSKSKNQEQTQGKEESLINDIKSTFSPFSKKR
jgi:hypothetical protein